MDGVHKFFKTEVGYKAVVGAYFEDGESTWIGTNDGDQCVMAQVLLRVSAKEGIEDN